MSFCCRHFHHTFFFGVMLWPGKTSRFSDLNDSPRRCAKVQTALKRSLMMRRPQVSLSWHYTFGRPRGEWTRSVVSFRMQMSTSPIRSNARQLALDQSGNAIKLVPHSFKQSVMRSQNDTRRALNRRKRKSLERNDWLPPMYTRTVVKVMIGIVMIAILTLASMVANLLKK